MEHSRVKEHLLKVLNHYQMTNVPAAQRILLHMERTYPPGAPDAIRLELWEPYFALGDVFLSEGKPAECVRIVRGMEALGSGITATVPAGSKKATLEVTRWGHMSDMMPWAFSQLFRAYKSLAAEVCAAAKTYVGIAYRILVGEEETLGDEFPQLV